MYLRLAHVQIQVRLQRPTVVAEVGFMLTVTKFFVPGFASSGLTPIPFESNDVVLEGKPSLRAVLAPDQQSQCCIIAVMIKSCWLLDIRQPGSQSISRDSDADVCNMPCPASLHCYCCHLIDYIMRSKLQHMIRMMSQQPVEGM